MEKEAGISQQKNNGCRFLFILGFNILSIMWILGLVLNVKNTFVQFFVIANFDAVELIDFEFATYKKITSGSPRKPHFVYILDGAIKGNNEKLSIRCSSISVSSEYIKNLIKTKKAKIWYLKKGKREFKVIQGKYPTKEDIVKSYLQLLFFFFFIPLLLLIRLLYLYGNKTIKFIKETITDMQNMERIILLLFLFPLGLSA